MTGPFSNRCSFHLELLKSFDSDSAFQIASDSGSDSVVLTSNMTCLGSGPSNLRFVESVGILKRPESDRQNAPTVDTTRDRSSRPCPELGSSRIHFGCFRSFQYRVWASTVQ